MNTVNVSLPENDHLPWLKSLKFYEKEFDILDRTLQEISKKNNTAEALVGIEHFQNQFIVQHANIDELKQVIHHHTFMVAEDAKKHPGELETVLVADHDNLKDQFDTFEKIANELRHEFNQFLTKWM